MMHLWYANYWAACGLEVSIRERVKRAMREKSNDVFAFKTKPDEW